MSTRITVTTDFSDGLYFFELGKDDDVATLKLLLESESGIAVAAQLLYLSGKQLPESGTLAQLGLDGDVSLLLRRKQQQQQPQPQQQQGQGRQPQARPQQQQQQDPATLMEVIRNDPATIDELSRGNPALLEAALTNNLEAFKRILEETTRMNQQAQEADRREQEYQAMLANADPFDPQAQARIAEYIRQKNVEENLVNALEHNPEAFARVTMLYINCSVNGIKLKAFVDSGAQSTIMSEKCAKACNIYHLLDTRYSGMAQGVGTARILGRVHVADMLIGNTRFVSSFTVIESQKGAQDLDFLLGLDNLKRHQACIDLKENVLRIGPEAVAFLPEHEIPGHADSLRSSVDGMNLGESGGSIPVGPPPPSANSNAPSNNSNNNNNNNAARPAPAPSAASNSGGFSEQVISAVQGLTGSSRDQVIQALRACGGNPDAAVQYLSGFSF